MIAFLKDLFSIIYVVVYILYTCLDGLIKSIFPGPLKSLDGEVVLVTGSASGIGAQLCIQLSQIRPTPTIICWDLNEHENDQLVWKLKQLGAKAYSYTVDVSDRTQIERAANKVMRDIGRVTILINNAGILPCHPFLNHNPKEITRCFDVNVFSQFWMIRQFLPDMLDLGPYHTCHIVTMCSAVGGLLPGGRNLVPYSSAQHAVHGYIEALKYELDSCSFTSMNEDGGESKEKPAKIQFTTVYPGYCETASLKNVRFKSRFPSILPVLTPEVVAMKTIEGLRRNAEVVYVPSTSMRLFTQLFNSTSPKAQRAILKLLNFHLEPESRHATKMRTS